MTRHRQVIVIRPQVGPQEDFLATPADIALFGGAAGAGKSWALMLEPLRHIHNPRFGGVIFRRTFPQIAQEGGLWERSEELYPLLGAKPNKANVRWRFPSGARIRFAHMQHETDMLNYQGGEIAYLAFDELTHFTERMFFYLLSRNRSMSGVNPYVRATTNPDPDSWVRRFIDWWIGPDGYAIPERSGRIRWFARVGDQVVWADTKQQLLDENQAIEPTDPLSFTFVLSRLKDNPALMARDPSYRTKLRALSHVERERLLGDEERGGNWDVRAAAGLLFKRQWVEVVDQVPAGLTVIRAWDFAGTQPSPTNPDPDWTVGVKVGRDAHGTHWILDAVRTRSTPAEVQKLFIATAKADGPGVVQVIPQDPGEAGKTVAQQRTVLPELRGHAVRAVRPTGDKVTRFTQASSLAEQGLLKLQRGAWNDWYVSDLEAFPDATHDDTADATSDAINHVPAPSTWGVKGATA